MSAPPEYDPDFSDDARVRDTLGMVRSIVTWTIVSPVIVLHELSHIVACIIFDVKVAGAGVMIIPHGNMRSVPVFQISSAFIYHEPVDDETVRAAISLAPLALILVAALVPAPLFLLFLLAGLTGVSDLLCMLGRIDTSSEAEPLFLFGDPSHVQRSLCSYEQ